MKNYSTFLGLSLVLGSMAWGNTPATHGEPPIPAATKEGKQPSIAKPTEQSSASDLALKRLMSGNKRFVSATMAHPNQTVERRNDLALSQAPFAVIVSCSDSRVPPEILFDQGVGDLFVVRSAGEVMGEVGIGSIEYAVAHLGVSLIMVLGHERCGAVKATLEGGEAPGSIGFVCAHIKPAADRAKKEGGTILDNAIQYNVENVAAKLALSPIIREAITKGQLKIARSVYDLDEGLVKPIP